MANEIQAKDVNTDAPTGTPPPGRVQTTEPSLGELFKELAQDSSVLIKQEIALAKMEMRENFRSLAKDMVKLAIGGGLLLVGLLALTAFLVAALGDMLGDEYWLGALIVGLLYALAGGILLMRGKQGLQNDDLRPEQTVQSLQADKRWAQAEVQQIKRELKS
jgi:uncharacterized membrane protein YqjE